MHASMRAGKALLTVAAVGLATAAAAPAADAAGKQFKQASGINYRTCANPDAVDAGFKCATITVPKSYADARDGNLRVAFTIRPASDTSKRSLGPLFVNYGGPGGAAVSTTQRAYAAIFPQAILDRFDIAAIDPRGVGESTPSIDCKANQITEGIYSQPALTPRNLDINAFVSKVRNYVSQCVRLNRRVLPYVTTGNVARDMDYVRSLLGAKKLNYYGFSYGTFLGATYASLFPKNYRTLVLDGALDGKDYINNPHEDLLEQTAGFERALSRYFQASTKDLGYSAWIADGDAEGSYDDLIAQANASPIPAPNAGEYGYDTAPVNGDDINNAVIYDLYAKQYWPEITQALNEAAAGDASLIRALSRSASGDNGDGTFDPGTDRYFTIGAVEQRYRRPLQQYLTWGESSWKTFDHFYSNVGYVEYNYGIFPIQGDGVFSGPFDVPKSAKTPLVVGTTYDPATVYRQAIRLTDDLGNARLLTMKGDGHTAYGNGSPCIDAAINKYILTSVPPPEGTTCTQTDIPFPPPPEAEGLRAQGKAAGQLAHQLSPRPLGKGW